MQLPSLAFRFVTVPRLVNQFMLEAGQPEEPPFANKSGTVMSKREVISDVQDVLPNIAIQLTRAGAAGQGLSQRYGGHCLRVSGSQFLTSMEYPCRRSCYNAIGDLDPSNGTLC